MLEGWKSSGSIQSSGLWPDDGCETGSQPASFGLASIDQAPAMLRCRDRRLHPCDSPWWWTLAPPPPVALDPASWSRTPAVRSGELPAALLAPTPGPDVLGLVELAAPQPHQPGPFCQGPALASAASVAGHHVPRHGRIFPDSRGSEEGWLPPVLGWFCAGLAPGNTGPGLTVTWLERAAQVASSLRSLAASRRRRAGLRWVPILAPPLLHG